MADGVFNIAKGRIAELARNVENASPTNSALIILALQDDASFPTDDALGDVDTLAAVLGLANVAEADFTNYARQSFVAANISVTVDDTGNEQFVDIDDIVYTDAGGASNNDIAKIVICYDADTTGGTDADIIPLTHHDVSITTDGNTVTVTPPADGFFGST